MCVSAYNFLHELKHPLTDEHTLTLTRVCVCACVFVYMRLCLGLCVGVCVLDWVRVFVCQCIQVTCLHALRQTQQTLQQNGTLAALQTEVLSPPLINQIPSGV